MSPGAREPARYPEAVAVELGRTFPSYSVRVRWDRGEPRFEAISRNDSHLYCVISPDPEEIRAELNRGSRQ